MGRKLDVCTTALAASLVVGALLACKKKEEPPPAASVAPAPTPEPPKSAEPPPPKKDEVKRYADKEIVESGTVRVKVANAKVYREADATTESIATLGRLTLVNRKARFSNFVLIEYPSGVGELSPGWIEKTMLEEKVVTVKDAGAAKPDGAAASPPDSGPPPVVATTPPPPASTTPPPTTPPPASTTRRGKLNTPVAPAH
jgi:hypothetical protein